MKHAYRVPVAAAVLAALIGVACVSRQPSREPYHPQARAITVTTIPLVTREMQSAYPFLKEDFAKGGLLEGKEVYAFEPSTITVYEGDTLHLTFVNPEDDRHAFALADFYIDLPGQTRRDTTYVARHEGIYTISCVVAAHLPMMRGQLVVLAPPSGASR